MIAIVSLQSVRQEGWTCIGVSGEVEDERQYENACGLFVNLGV